MIADSVAWKDRLRDDLVRLRKRLRSVDKEYDGYDDIELFTFTSAFIIRKLVDSLRLSIEAEFCKVLATAYPARRVELDDRDILDIARQFRLLNGEHVEVGLRDLCNELIHSHYFIAACTERSTHWSLYFASDANRSKRALRIPLARFERLVRFVSDDEWDMQSRRFRGSNDEYGPSHDLKYRPADDGVDARSKRQHQRSAEAYFRHLNKLLLGGMNIASARREAAKTYLVRRHGTIPLLR